MPTAADTLIPQASRTKAAPGTPQPASPTRAATAEAQAVGVPEPEKQKTGTSTPIIDSLVPGWQPARFSMQGLIVLAIIVACMLLASAGLMVIHRLFHFFVSDGWSKSPVEISELGVAGVFTLKQTQSDQQAGDRLRDGEIDKLTARLDGNIQNHDHLTSAVSDLYGVFDELKRRVDSVEAVRVPRRNRPPRRHAADRENSDV